MQPSQVRDFFSSVEQSIGNAAELCQMTTDVPEDVRECLSELERESEHARRMLEQEDDDNRIIQYIDRLEKLGDRAIEACREAGNAVDPQVGSAAQQARDAIADMKRRLLH
jgi:predicted site-specific integrase-resolvase